MHKANIFHKRTYILCGLGLYIGAFSTIIVIKNLSVQVMPSPSKPGLHEQLKPPSVFVQVPFTRLQLSDMRSHSSMSGNIK